jgi:RNA polymerase sigma-70 factor (ECF subfamily)
MVEQTSADPWVCAAFARYGRLLTDYAARIVGDRDRAADVVQETFLRLCTEVQRKGNRDGAEPKIPEWLYTVCRNRAIDVRRKERRMFQTEDNHVLEKPAAEASPGAAYAQKESSGDLLRLLERLPENQGEVLRLRFQHDLSYKQIAEVTGHSVSNVGFLIHTGIKTLREKFAGNAGALRASLT